MSTDLYNDTLNQLSETGMSFTENAVEIPVGWYDPHRGGKMHTSQTRQIWDIRRTAKDWFRGLGEAFYNEPVFLSCDVPLGYAQFSGSIHVDIESTPPEIPVSLQGFIALEDADGACTGVVPEEISLAFHGINPKNYQAKPRSAADEQILENSLVEKDLVRGETLVYKDCCWHRRSKTGAGRRKNLCIGMNRWQPNETLTVISNGLGAFVTGAPTNHRGRLHPGLGALRFRPELAFEACWYKEILDTKSAWNPFTGLSPKRVIDRIAREIVDFYHDSNAVQAWCEEHHIPSLVLEFIMGW